MDNKSIAATILLVLMSLSTGVAEIVTKPTDTEAVVGGSTNLNCSTNSRQKIIWFRAKLGQDEEIFYRNDAFIDNPVGRFKIERNEANGAYNLVISSVKIEDAGFYRCQEETGSNGTAELIVLDRDPVCEPHLDMHEIIGTNKCGIKPTQLIISCTVTYHGNEAPILAWRKVSDDTLISEGVTNKTIDNNRVVYNLTLRGNSSVKDGDSYFCNTTRSTTLNVGCKSGEVKVKGTGADCPSCVASEICEPYIKPYKAALICFFLIILPAAVVGAIFAFWYLKIHRPKKLENGVSSTENPRYDDTNTEAGTKEEMTRLQEFALVQESQGEKAEEERSNPINHQLPEAYPLAGFRRGTMPTAPGDR